jgi:hypothetical protein
MILLRAPDGAAFSDQDAPGHARARPGRRTFGTLCCFSFKPVDGVGMADLKRLKYAAQLLSAKLQPGV